MCAQLLRFSQPYSIVKYIRQMEQSPCNLQITLGENETNIKWCQDGVVLFIFSLQHPFHETGADAKK